MKTLIVIGVLLVLFFIFVSNFSRFMGGISTNKAAQNLEHYLEKEHKGELGFRELNRFFNAATMNPNMFTVVIFHKEIPEIEFYCHVNPKELLENDTLSYYGTENLKIADLYQRERKRYETRQKVKADFVNDIPEIKFENDRFEIFVPGEIETADLHDVIERFVARLNSVYEELDIPYTMSLFIKTEAHPDGFIDIPLENIENQWHPQMFMLSATMNDFAAIEKDIKQRIQTDLDASYPNYEIDDNYRKIILDKSSLSKIAWVQYLKDKTIDNDKNEKWQNPLTGLYITYYDIQTGHLYFGEMVSQENDNISYDETLALIKLKVEAEGIQM
ncbi:hypothetical protein SAMN05192545_2558 [Maribacter dokdonensis]|uniref:DUF4825 domain-containing protein n=1 Tax=Maribacter dokdonensis TaxID=320912 RepID=A0ABY0UPU7_9FLAO|nr:hypothetical protein [Maribacter dokdonensis]SDT00903.1 hypothetical protein SAMN05192545_2558 [Maribacter dokdonensis]